MFQDGTWYYGPCCGSCLGGHTELMDMNQIGFWRLADGTPLSAQAILERASKRPRHAPGNAPPIPLFGQRIPSTPPAPAAPLDSSPQHESSPDDDRSSGPSNSSESGPDEEPRWPLADFRRDNNEYRPRPILRAEATVGAYLALAHSARSAASISPPPTHASALDSNRVGTADPGFSRAQSSPPGTSPGLQLQDNSRDQSPWPDDQSLRAITTTPPASADELNTDLDDFLAQLHNDPRYSDYLGEEHTGGGPEVVAATRYADDAAVMVRHRRIATPAQRS